MTTAADRDKAIAALKASDLKQNTRLDAFDKYEEAESGARRAADDALAARVQTLEDLLGRTITIVGAHDDRLVALEKAIKPPVVPPVVPPVPPVTPPIETPRPDGKVVEFIGTADQFTALCKDLTVGTIVLGDRYSKWDCFLDVLRTAAKPLLVEGHDTIFDGTGLSNAPAFRIGWSTPAGFITFDGTFFAQGYRITYAGVVMAKQFDTFGFHGLTIRDSFGDKSIDSSVKQQHAHGLYIGSNGPASPRSRNWSSRGLVVEGPDVPSTDPAYRMLNGVQTDGSPNVDGVVITGAKLSKLNRGYFFYNSPTGLLVDGGSITDCAATIDNAPNTAQGIVRNVKALRSGPLAPGSGSWKSGALVAGLGNTSA